MPNYAEDTYPLRLDESRYQRCPATLGGDCRCVLDEGHPPHEGNERKPHLWASGTQEVLDQVAELSPEERLRIFSLFCAKCAEPASQCREHR